MENRENQTMKILKKEELMILTRFCLENKIMNNTMDNEIFEKVDILGGDGKAELQIFFKDTSLYFPVADEKLYELYSESECNFMLFIRNLIDAAENEYVRFAEVNLNKKDI